MRNRTVQRIPFSIWKVKRRLILAFLTFPKIIKKILVLFKLKFTLQNDLFTIHIGIAYFEATHAADQIAILNNIFQ